MDQKCFAQCQWSPWLAARVAGPLAKRGVWHRIEFYLQLDSAPGKADGVAILKIDDKLCIHPKDVPFQQGLVAQSWDRMALPSMFGGGAGPRESFGWQMDDVEVWDDLPRPASSTTEDGGVR